MKTSDFAIDNLPVGANPVYECNVDAKPLVFKPGVPCGKMVAGRKRKDKRNYIVPLYPITGKIFNQINFFLHNMEANDFWMGGVVLCIQGDKIGLACHNPKLKQKKSGGKK